MELTNEDFEAARAGLLKLQVKAMRAVNTRLCEQLSAWLYELETHRWIAVKSFPSNKLGGE